MAQITKRKNGAYLIRVSCGYDVQGKQITQSMTWKPPKEDMSEKAIAKELNIAAVDFEQKCLNGQIVNNEKFQAFCENSYFPNCAERTLKKSNVELCRSYTPRIYEHLGHLRLDKITPRTIDGFIAWLEKQPRQYEAVCIYRGDLKAYLKRNNLTQQHFAQLAGVSPQTVKSIIDKKTVRQDSAEKIAAALGKNYSDVFLTDKSERLLAPKTIKNIISFVSAVFDYAVHLRIIKDNPCRNAMLPKIEKKPINMFTIEETKQFLDILDRTETPIKYKAFFQLAIFGGFRSGEIRALEWNDIEFDTGMIHIRRTTHYTKTLGHFDTEPKSKSSVRDLVLPDFVIFTLKQLRNDQLSQRLKLGDLWINTNRLFTTWNGQQMGSNAPFAWLKKTCEQNDLPVVNIHSFRHLNASLLISQGTDVKTVQSVLGHSQASTTLDIYATAFKEREARALGAVASVLMDNRDMKQA